ncbi:MAG: hypothetical protein J6K84_02975 [Oscillospiraceae bacterium]|nr:hypothetical protein [Oscillospiraceae bacterium]
MEKPNPLPSFSQADIKKVLASPEGQALLRMLNKDGGALLQKAAAAVKSGDIKTAQELVRPVMESPDATKLIERLNGQK